VTFGFGERPDEERPASMVGVNIKIAGGERDGLLGAIMTGSPGKWIVLAASRDELNRGFPLAWFRVPSEHVELVFESWDSYAAWWALHKTQA
jgi:hypothetical protein